MCESFSTDNSGNMCSSEIVEVLAILRRGGTILYPTDTIWGLGCDARRPDAVERLYQIKERPSTMSMLVLVDSIERLAQYVGILPDFVQEELQKHQRPTTIIYPVVEGLAQNLYASDGSLGIRVVAHPFCRAIIEGLGAQLVSTSANLYGHPTGRDLQSIDPRIRGRVDWIAPAVYDTAVGGTASRILKIVGNRFEIIRE